MIEYRVRPVTRFIITRYEALERTGTLTTIGEFDSNIDANCCAGALHLTEPGSLCELYDKPEPTGLNEANNYDR